MKIVSISKVPVVTAKGVKSEFGIAPEDDTGLRSIIIQQWQEHSVRFRLQMFHVDNVLSPSMEVGTRYSITDLRQYLPAICRYHHL